MKKIIIVGLIAFCMLGVTGIASASSTVDLTWDVYSGGFSQTVNSNDDQTTHFETGGNHAWGNFHVNDAGPGCYGIHTVSNSKEANIENGGYIHSWTKRDDSKVSMYGNPGERTETYIFTADGNAFMDWNVRTAYAEMKNCQYPAGKQFEATGTHIIQHNFTNEDGEGAEIDAYGTGTSEILLQGESEWVSSFNMGHIKCCGNNHQPYARYKGTGTGTFELHGWADNELRLHNTGMTIPGDGSENSATLDLSVNFAGNFEFGDFGIKGN